MRSKTELVRFPPVLVTAVVLSVPVVDWMMASRGGERRREQDMDDDYGSGLFLRDDSDGEKLANRIGVDTMNKLVEVFEEMSSNVLPAPADDAYIDAMHTNHILSVKYLMADFESNPDIDEKPPISLRDALEKVKRGSH